MAGTTYFEARQGSNTFRIYADAKRLVMTRIASDYDGLGETVGRSAARKAGGVLGSLIFEAFFSGGTDRKQAHRAEQVDKLTIDELAMDPDNTQIPLWAITGAKLEQAGSGVRLSLTRKRGDVLVLGLMSLRDYYACRGLIEKPLAGRLQLDPGLPPVARAP